MTATDFSIVLPEVVLAVYAMAALLFGAYADRPGMARLLTWTTAALMVVLAFWISVKGGGDRSAFGGMFLDDPFARFAKVAVLLSAAAVLTMSESTMARRGLAIFEYPILVTLAVRSEERRVGKECRL